MTITRTPDVSVPAQRFVPDGFDPADLEALREFVDALLARGIDSPAALERWVLDWNGLLAPVLAERTRRRIAMTRATGDAAARRAHLDYEARVVPAWKRHEDALRRRYLASRFRRELGPRYEMFHRRLANAAALFAEENVALLAHDEELGATYARMVGGRTVSLRGRPLTLQQCAARLEEPDRATREEAWRTLAASRAADAARTDALFDEMLELRQRIATNAGCDDYRAYRFRELARFDYGPEECFAFHDAVAQVVVPVVRARAAARARALGVPALRPWDREADPAGAGRREPFRSEAELIELGLALFAAVDPRFAAEFSILVRNGLLDLMSRPGKAPGGYNAGLADIRLPFIFANAAGLQKDVKTLLHEGGHAFHTLATRDEPILDLARAPMEFCEVASMSMELFGMEHFDAVYPPAEARRAAIEMLDRRLWLLTWCATIDAFQHWLYTHPGHGREERRVAWMNLRRRFEPGSDWSGLAEPRGHEWHGQLHLFRHPFYYVEYGIALLGSVQVWRNFRRDAEGAVAAYREALALGGRRPLPDLFAAAGARFALAEPTVREVVGEIVAKLQELEAPTP